MVLDAPPVVLVELGTASRVASVQLVQVSQWRRIPALWRLLPKVKGDVVNVQTILQRLLSGNEKKGKALSS
jgi:hypothetical protein